MHARRPIFFGVIAMAIVVAVANVAVGDPINDWITWGALTYPVAFLVTDVTSEIFGKKKANLLVLAGFSCSLLSLLIIFIVLKLQPAEAWLSGSPYDTLEEMNTAFNSVFLQSIFLIN